MGSSVSWPKYRLKNNKLAKVFCSSAVLFLYHIFSKESLLKRKISSDSFKEVASDTKFLTFYQDAVVNSRKGICLI